MCSLQPCVFGLASSAMFVPGFVFSPLSWNVHLSRWLLAGNWVQSRCLVRQAHFFPTAPACWRCARVIPFTVVIVVYNCQCQLILAGLWHSRKDVKPNHLQSRKLPKMSLAAKSRWQLRIFFAVQQLTCGFGWLEKKRDPIHDQFLSSKQNGLFKKKWEQSADGHKLLVRNFAGARGSTDGLNKVRPEVASLSGLVFFPVKFVYLCCWLFAFFQPHLACLVT